SHLQQVERAVDVDPVGQPRLPLRLGGEQGRQVIDDVEVVGGDQGVEQGDVGDVAGHDAVTAGLDVRVEGVQVQSDDARPRQLGKAVDQAVADLAVGAGDQDRGSHGAVSAVCRDNGGVVWPQVGIDSGTTSAVH